MSGYEVKLARADEHLDALYRETDAWGNGDPLAVDRESNADGTEHIFSLRFKSQPEIWRWAVLLGDALHNLRGALDHLIYALAVAQTGSDPPADEKVLAFPICSEPSFFKKSRRRIASLDQPTQAAIEKAQPYNRLKPGKWFMPLWWLASLHDVDKHRFAHLAPIGSRPNEIVVHDPRGTYQVFWNTGTLVDGAPLLRVVFTEPNPNVRVDFQATAAVIVNVKNTGPYSVYWVTRRIRREVGVVCRYLACFFPP